MSIQTTLAAGFLLLGGVLLRIAHALDYSDWYALLGSLFMLTGAAPLVIHLAKDWLSWFQKLPDSSADNPKKED